MGAIQSYPYDVVVGEIGIINGWIVTPNGNAPLQGAQWIVADRTWIYTYLPTSCVIIGWILAILVMVSQTTALTGGGREDVWKRGPKVVEFRTVPTCPCGSATNLLSSPCRFADELDRLP